MGRDSPTEQYLNKGGYKYVYAKSIQFSKIDLEQSRNNPARILRRLDQEKALEYGIKMEAGDEFPGLLLLNHENPHNGFDWIVATGMHRIEGAIMYGIDHFDAYLVTEPDAFRRETLLRQANQWVGMGMTQAEILQNVLHLYETYNKPLNQLAKEWYLKLPTLQNAANERKARLRAKRMGTDFDRTRVPQASVLALQSIHSDVVFDKAAEFVAYTQGVTSTVTKELVAEVRKARDERSQLGIVQKYKDKADAEIRAQKVQHGRPRLIAITKVIKSIKTLNNQFLRPLEELHVAVLEDRPAQIMLAKTLKENLDRYIAALEKAERMSRPPQPEVRRPVSPQPPEMRA